MKERNLEQKKTPMWIDLVRHGMTRGNEERRYIGITDEPLSERGRKLAEQCMYEMPEIVFSSPLKRCVETAEILYPDQDIYIIEEESVILESLKAKMQKNCPKQKLIRGGSTAMQRFLFPVEKAGRGFAVGVFWAGRK